MKKIAIFYTGGTIGMMKKDGVFVPSSEGPLQKWLATYAEAHHINIALISGYVPIDSSNADPALWSKLSQDIKNLKSEYDGVLILHGTDTMAYTASALSFLLNSLNFPVILTGSQIPLSEPDSDADLNLSQSLDLLTTLPEGRIPNEVFIFFGKYLLRGNRSTKIDNEGKNAFDSPNCPYCLRYNECGKIEFNADFKSYDQPPFPLADCDSLVPINIKVRLLSPGIQELDIDPNTCQALILMTYGAGNAPTDPDFLEKIQKLTEQGILVLNLSQCLHKTALPSNYEVGAALRKRGAIDMRDITLEACIAKLYYLLNVGHLKLRGYLPRSLVGELTPAKTNFPSKLVHPELEYSSPAKTCLILQNSKYFELGLLGDVLRKHYFTVISLFVPEEYSKLTKIDSRQIDLIVVLGANTSVNYSDQLSWIAKEIKFIKNRIEQDLPLLGIGLGGQLIAKAAGAEIQPGPQGKEIGFYPLTLTAPGKQLMEALAPEKSMVFTFHSETFALPRDATLLASTEKYPQAFSIGDHCLALQFHAEITLREFNAITSEYFDQILTGGFDLAELEHQAKIEFPKLQEQAKIFFTQLLREFFLRKFRRQY